MPDVQRVEPKDGDADVTHWTVSGPGGVAIEWDAKIVDEEHGRKIAAASLFVDPQRKVEHALDSFKTLIEAAPR